MTKQITASGKTVSPGRAFPCSRGFAMPRFLNGIVEHRGVEDSAPATQIKIRKTLSHLACFSYSIIYNSSLLAVPVRFLTNRLALVKNTRTGHSFDCVA